MQQPPDKYFSNVRSVIDRLICCSVVDGFDFLAGSLGYYSSNQCDDKTADKAGNDLINTGILNKRRSDR